MMGYGHFNSVFPLIVTQARAQPIRLTILTLYLMQSELFIYEAVSCGVRYVSETMEL